MKIRRLASSHGVGPSLWKSQLAALGRKGEFAADLHPWGGRRPGAEVHVIVLLAGKPSRGSVSFSRHVTPVPVHNQRGNGAVRSWNELDLKVQWRQVEPRMAVLNSLVHQACCWLPIDLAGQAVTRD